MISRNIPVNASMEADEVLLLPLAGRVATVISSLFIFTSSTMEGFNVESSICEVIGLGVGFGSFVARLEGDIVAVLEGDTVAVNAGVGRDVDTGDTIGA